MNIHIALDRRLYGPQGAMRHLWVRVEAPRSERPPSERAPLDIELVLDRSGSMGGAKIEYTRQAASMAVNLLRESDRCGLVAYDDEILALARCQAVNDEQQSLLLGAIGQLYARGSTNLFGGWLAGSEELGRLEDGRIRRVLMMTDGLANVGVTDRAEILHHVRELAARGVGTTAFGVGLDFDEMLVSGMAEAGNGHFYYIERPEQIPDFLASELGELLRVVARSVRLAVVVSGGATISNLNEVPLIGQLYHLGDLAEGSITDLCFVLEVPPAQAARTDVQVTLTWQEPDTGEERTTSSDTRLLAAPEAEVEAEAPDAETMEKAVKARSARARSDALRLNDAGDFAAARACLTVADFALRDIAATYAPAAEEAAMLRSIEPTFSRAMASKAKKRMMYDAYKARRSRRDVE
jgi:Ca-activated chloride channel family protein